MSSAALASGMSITVPHPTITLPSYFLRKLATWSRQPGVVSVNSTMSKPPSIAACMAGAHCSALGVRRTAQALYLANVSITFCADAGVCLYAPEARVFMPRDDCINLSAILCDKCDDVFGGSGGCGPQELARAKQGTLSPAAMVVASAWRLVDRGGRIYQPHAEATTVNEKHLIYLWKSKDRTGDLWSGSRGPLPDSLARDRSSVAPRP